MRISLNWLCCAAFVIFPAAQAIYTSTAQGIEVGPYAIVNCKSNAISIARLLKGLESFIRPVLADLGSPTASDAYMTFFKNIRYRSYVREVFSNITGGASVNPEPETPGAETHAPIFFCVDGRDQFTWEVDDNNTVDAYTRCRSYTDVPAMALLNTPYTIICPAFHSQPAIPAQSSASCYNVVSNQNRFEQDGKSLIRYQTWHIIHELVHYYVWSTKEENFDVYPINTCLNLRDQIAVLNPNSYTYYAANIRLGCSEFPVGTRRRPPSRGSGVELLEIGANSTTPSGNKTVTLVVQDVSIDAVPDTHIHGNLAPSSANRSLTKGGI